MKTILLILTATCFTISALAHPGRTDAKGGHTQNGKYHVHKKPEAKKPEAKKTAPPKKKK